jgi:hypothetical protein
MKKTLLLATLLIGFLAQAQNIELLHQADNCNLDFARKFSDEIISDSKTEYIYFDSVESKYSSTCSLIYVKEGLTEIQKKEVTESIAHYNSTKGRYGFTKDNCMVFEFKINYVGRNVDLEQQGVKQYAFNIVEGKFLDLFPFFQKNIDPTATTENTATTGSYSVRRDQDKYWYNFIRTNQGIWYLKNMSDRF